MNASAEMPKYRSHKQVWALRIDAIEVHEDKSATIAPRDEGYGLFRTDKGWAERFKGTEDDPGIYVVYDDGYASWSPTEAFVKGYTPVGGDTWMASSQAKKEQAR